MNDPQPTAATETSSRSAESSTAAPQRRSSTRPAPNRQWWWLAGGVLFLLLAAGPAWRSVRITRLMWQAGQARDRLDHVQSAALLQQAVKLRDDRVDLRFQLAVAHRRAGQLDGFMRELEEASRRGWPVSLIDRQRLLYRIQLGDVGGITPDHPLFSEEVSTTESIEVCEALADGYIRALRYAEASWILDRWLALAPQHDRPHLLLADLLERMEKAPEARDHYQAVLALQPQHATARRRLAQNLEQNSRFSEAAEQYRLQLQYYPSDAAAAVGLAKSLVGLASHSSESQQAAQQALRDALKLPLEDEPRSDMLLELGRMELVAGRREAGLEQLRLAQKAAPKNPRVLYLLGQTLKQQGAAEEARELLDDAKRLQGLAQKLGLMSRDILQQPDNLDVRVQLGELELELGRVKDAENTLKSVAFHQPDHRRAHELLGQLYAERGDSRNAAHHAGIVKQIDAAAAARAAKQEGAAQAEDRPERPAAEASGSGEQTPREGAGSEGASPESPSGDNASPAGSGPDDPADDAAQESASNDDSLNEGSAGSNAPASSSRDGQPTGSP